MRTCPNSRNRPEADARQSVGSSKILKFAVGLTLCIFASGPAFSMPSTCTFANDSKEEKLCISYELDQSERTKGVYLQAAKEAVAIDESLVQQISDSQAAWLSYRKEQCDNGLLRVKLGSKSFSFRSSMECKVDLTQNRTSDIWAVYLARSESRLMLLKPQFSRK